MGFKTIAISRGKDKEDLVKKLGAIQYIDRGFHRKNVLAKQYLEKLRKEEVSIDWAHRVLINLIRQQRMLKMMQTIDISAMITKLNGAQYLHL